jgi:proteic killer suppression protein
MIRSFPDKKTEGLFPGRMVREFSGFRKAAEWKLTMLDDAPDLKDLLSLPGNRLEMVTRIGEYSIRIYDQKRMCFLWKALGPDEVEITDYH